MITEENSLPELPKGWVWARLEELALAPKQDIVDGPFGSDLKASEYKHIPVIMLTGFINKEVSEQARADGCFDFITKPVKRQKLIESIQRAIASARS